MTDHSQEPVEEASTETQAQPAKKPRSPEYNAILGLGAVILALAGFLGTQLYWIKADLNASQARADADRRAFQARADADRRAFQAEAAADRRGFDARMEEFRREMRRLSERQSRLEGMQEAQASATSTGS